MGGGGGGCRTTPPVAHPQDFVPPVSNFVPPFSNFVPPFSNFVPPFSNFVPPLECGWRHTGNVQGGGGLWMSKRGVFSIFRRADECPRGGGSPGACDCPRVGAFFKLMTSRGQCPRGGGFRPSKFRPPPHLAGWLRAWPISRPTWNNFAQN